MFATEPFKDGQLLALDSTGLRAELERRVVAEGFLDSFEDFVTARCGQAPKHAVDLLDGGGLQGDDRRHVVHDTRVAKHALDA